MLKIKTTTYYLVVGIGSLRRKSSSRPSSEGGSPQPPSPPSRHEKWKLARLRSSGAYSSNTARKISKRIDILTTTIGQPEHLGHVRVAGTGVGIRDYFGSSSRHTSYEYSEAQEQRLT
ncbi:hypothetical protein LR48_Vigan07g112300 [Vigna angularis]|uniref:Uncharacterized protein n=1 Tax=Phaseolus angularis TaxID=3914 RepID=A0A0L9UXZ3_PHAAN|nr:hypothetical protein LR48_Vigan07g112300 [Vigna angularis]